MYDLQSPLGFVIANGIIAHNCDAIPIVHESQITSEADVWDGENDPDEFSKERLARRRAIMEEPAFEDEEPEQEKGLALAWCLRCGISHRQGNKAGCPCPEPPGRPGPCVCEGGGGGAGAAPDTGAQRDNWRPPTMEKARYEERLAEWTRAKEGLSEAARAAARIVTPAQESFDAAALSIGQGGLGPELSESQQGTLHPTLEALATARKEAEALEAAARAEYDRAAVRLGPDFFYALAERDPAFIEAEIDDMANAWAHIGGPGPNQMKFAANAAFGLDAQVWDEKANAFVVADTASLSDRAQIARWAGVMRSEWESGQGELKAGEFEYDLKAEDTSAAEQEQYDSWSDSSDHDQWVREQASEAFRDLDDDGRAALAKGAAGGEAKLLEWGRENIDEVKNWTSDDPPDDEENLAEWIRVNAANAYAKVNEDAIFDAYHNDFTPDSTSEWEHFTEDIFQRDEATETHSVGPDDWPLTLYRGIGSRLSASGNEYLHNAVESWSVSRAVAEDFGGNIMEREFPRERVLAFQGSKHWRAKGGGFNEGEFMILADAPYWLRQPGRTQRETMEAAGQLALPLKRRIPATTAEIQRVRGEHHAPRGSQDHEPGRPGGNRLPAAARDGGRVARGRGQDQGRGDGTATAGREAAAGLVPRPSSAARWRSLVRGLKHFGPGPHPGTGTPQTVHAFAARAESLGLDRDVAKEVRRSYAFEGGKVKTDPDGKPVLTPEGEARAARVSAFVEAEVGKHGESEYDSQRRYGKSLTDGLATDPERRALQLKVINDYLTSQEELGAKAEENPVALITGGLGGAGKTRTLEMMGFEMGDDRLTGERTPKGYVVINPDILKGLIHANGGSMQVPGLTPGEAAVFLHEEASSMAKYLSREATTLGYNVVWDYTMGSSASVIDRVQELVDPHGPRYTVDAMFVDIPPERSARSAEKRWHGGNAGALDNLLGFDDKWKSGDYGDTFMGRFVPPSFIASADGKNRKAFDAVVHDWPGAVAEYERRVGRPAGGLEQFRIRNWDRYDNRWDERGKRYVAWAEGSRAQGPPGGIVDSRRPAKRAAP